MKILLNVRRAPTRRMVVATPTFLRGGALETESPGHYLNLPAGTSSPFSPGSEISGRGVMQALPDHRVAGRRPQLGDHPAALEGGPGSRKPDRLEVLHRGRRGIAGSAGGEWQPEGGRELPGGTPTTAEVGSHRLWVGTQQLEPGVAGPGDGQTHRSSRQSVHARDLLENPARPIKPSSCSGAVPLAKGSSPAASARDPQPAFHLETRRGSLLRRRSGPRPESANRSRLDSAGTTTLGSHAGAEREALPRGSLEPPHGPSGLGRGTPETELDLLEPAARCAATLSPVLHLILDNYIIHYSKIVKTALAEWDGRFRLHFLPPYSPDENRIERLWLQLHANVTRNHRCRTISRLLTKVRHFLRNATPFPGSQPSLARVAYA